jgi:hypothetical protein
MSKREERFIQPSGDDTFGEALPTLQVIVNPPPARDPASLGNRELKRSRSDEALILIKSAHTVIWVFFVTAIAAIWLLGWRGAFIGAFWAIAIVAIEVAILASNRGKCPLGVMAARYTGDSRANFDIYLPAWLAARTKSIFGTLYATGIVFTIARYASSSN